MSHSGKALWLEQLRPGLRIPLGEFTCDAALVSGYADLFNARHPIHVDAEFAMASRFGRLIAHGPLPVAKSLSMLGEVFGEGMRVLLSMGQWQFMAPVFVDDRVICDCHVLKIQGGSASSAAAVTLEMRLLSAQGDLLQRGELEVLINRQAKPKDKAKDTESKTP